MSFERPNVSRFDLQPQPAETAVLDYLTSRGCQIETFARTVSVDLVRVKRYHVITLRSGMVERHKVVLFLTLMKETAHRKFVFVGRPENIATLAKLGITRAHAKSLVLGLTPEDCVSGPGPDHNNPGLDFWVFGLRLSGMDVYIKLQVVISESHCVCVSFHEAERPLHYPLR